MGYLMGGNGLKKVLAVGAVCAMVAFMKPAVADDGDEFQRVEGQGYSGMGSDDKQINAQFQLFKTTKSGTRIDAQLIPDKNPDDNIVKTFLFKGAIRNFTLGQGQLRDSENSLNENDYDASGNLIITNEFVANEEVFAVGDFLAELITQNSDKYVRYSIFENYGITKPYTYFILDPQSPRRTFLPLPNPINLYQAVNDLSYIVDNNLLDAGFTSRNEAFLLDTEIPTDVFNLIKTATFKKNIPEPSATVSLLTLGALGAGSLLKCKMKNS